MDQWDRGRAQSQLGSVRFVVLPIMNAKVIHEQGIAYYILHYCFSARSVASGQCNGHVGLLFRRQVNSPERSAPGAHAK